MSRIKEKEYQNHLEFLKDYYKVTYSILLNYLKLINNNECELRHQVLDSINQDVNTIKNNANSSSIFIAGEEICYRYNLNDLEWICIVISILFRCSEDFRNLISRVADSSESLSYQHVIKFYNFENDASKIENFEEKVEHLKSKLKPLGFKENTLEINNNLFQAISRNLDQYTSNSDAKIYNINNLNDAPLLIREDKAEEIENTISRALAATQNTIYYYMYGQQGIGKKTLVKRAARLLEKNLLIIDLESLSDNYKEKWFNRFLEVVYENKNPETFVCLDNFHVFFDENSKNKKGAFSVIQALENQFKVVFVLSNKKIDDSNLEENFFWFNKHVSDLDSDENFKMWQENISTVREVTDEKPEEVAGKFNFTPKQIKGTIRNVKKVFLENNEEKLNKQQFYKCAYSQVISTLEEKAKLISKKYTWSDMVIDDDTKLQLQRACERITYKYKVHNTWGMGTNLLYGKGLSMMFHGKPGTGKTMAAQVIASELGLDLYKVDIAKIVSKYIGETEKNLKEIFDEARKSNVILLFDEADSLFSKRTDIKDSHDRNANIEVSFLLQQMEDYDGIVILTTNKDQNIDEAFNRRITFKIQFSSPSPGIRGSANYEKNLKLRKDLWDKFFKNGKLPLDKDIDFEYLATQFDLSGAQIRKIALTAAFLAAAQNSEKVKFKHILETIKNILKISLDEFGHYEYLLKDYK